MSINVPNDFREWMDELDVRERERLDVLLTSQYVRMFLIGLFDHGATWDAMVAGVMNTRPSTQVPIDQVITICNALFENDVDELGQTLSDMKEGGYGVFVKEVLQKLTITQRNCLIDYISL